MNKLDQGYNIMKKYIEEYYTILVDKFDDEIAIKTIEIKEIQDKNTK